MTSEKTEVTLEQLPIHAIRSKLKDEGILYKNTDKKVDLIEMLRSGETKHKPKEIKRAPRLEDSKTEKVLPVVPKDIRGQLEKMQEQGLDWKIDEDSCSITFIRRIGNRTLDACCTLDQSSHNIMQCALSIWGRKEGPSETSNRNASVEELTSRG